MSKKKSNPLPPRWVTRLFVWFCRPADMDDLLGDMEEMYSENVSAHSVVKARYIYFSQCFTLAFSYTVKKRKRDYRRNFNQRSTQININMYFNYLKMVLRRLRKRFVYSFINISGLGIGLATCFIIGLFVQTETSFDRFHEDADKIYRLTKSFPAGGRTVETLEMRNYFMPAIAQLIPAIDSHCQIENVEEGVFITDNGNTVTENSIAFVSEDFFNFFSFPLLAGNANDVLSQPYTVALSERAALKYFGSESALGKNLRLTFPADERTIEVKVAGLFQDMPSNSHFHKDVLISMSTGVSEDRRKGMRGFIMQHSYFKLGSGRSIEEVDEALPGIEDKHAPGFFKKLGMHLGTQPMLDIHLTSSMQNEFEANGNSAYVRQLAALGVVILLIAAFNYMNLATAQSLDQAKEVGIRKVMGSHKRQLILRFLIESITMSALGLLLAIVIVSLALPSFSILSGQNLLFSLSAHWQMIPVFIGITLLIGLLAGIYPAFYMSGFQVAKSLKGGLSRHGKGVQLFRKSLVVTQFVMSIVLMLVTGAIFNQFGFMMDKELGLATEAVVLIDTSTQEVNRQFDILKDQLERQPEVIGVTGSGSSPISDFSLRETNGVMLPGTSEEITMNYVRVDRHFLDFYEMAMIKGRGYDEFEGEAHNAVVINRSAMESLGFDESTVIGQQILVYDQYKPFIIGVVEDAHFESLHKEIGPVYFQWMGNASTDFNTLSVKLGADELITSIAAIEKVYNDLIKTTPMDLVFLDDRVKNAYRSEKFFMRTFGVFATLAVLMACMGALGLSMQVVTTKRKEVSVRKVLGASVSGVVALLTSELIALVLLANLIAWPLAYWGMNRWLQNFPYQESLGAGVFVLVLTASLIMASLSVGVVSVKAALANPIKSLKSE